MIHFVIESINKGLVLSCHDISDGGLVTSISEMLMTGSGVGAKLEVDSQKLRADQALFSESSGFVLEVSKEKSEELETAMKGFGLPPIRIGTTGGKSMLISHNGRNIVDLSIQEMKRAWDSGLGEAMR